MTLPTVDEVIDADRPTLKHYCKLYGLPVKGKNRYLRARLFELIRLGKAKEDSGDEIAPANGLSRFRRALLLASKGEAERAKDELDKCLEACPESGLSLIAKSLLLDVIGEEDSVSYSDEAVAIDDRVEVLLGRALVLLNAGRWSDAEDAADSLTGRSDDPIPWLLKALATVPAGRPGLAVQFLDEALEIDDRIPELWNMKGEIIVRLGNYGNSLPCFDQAINLREDYSEAHNNKGVALLHLGHYDDALECFERALGSTPKYPEAMANKSVALHLLGNGIDSLRWIDMAAEIQPTAELWNNRGQILLSMDRFDEALSSFGRALEMNEDSVEARQGREIALEKMEQKRREEESLAQPTEVRKFLEAGETGPT
ncbi:MAG: tetratricopeptide repeat protein [Thermoplasmata archaeon]|nr:tetratricopeptide repeat protein [Thermoplasmata archaeon]